MQKQIKKLVKELSKIKSIKAIYLFGSHATGNAGPLSDIDICVIAPNITEKEKEEVTRNGFENMDLMLFSDLPLTIQVRVLRQGKPLYLTDKNYINTLTWRITKEYWDFKPTLKRFIETYLPGANYV